MLKKTTTSKIVSGLVGLSMLMMATPVAAQQSVADLTAQINSLLATIASLQAQLAGMQGGSSAGATAQFTMDLKVGSQGADVVRLQDMLVMKGHLVMPAGVAKGYFGALTKAAVVKWQLANALPGTGFFGPMSRAKINATIVVTPGTGTGTGTGTGITTPGAEGTLTVTSNNSGLVSTVYEGDTKAAIYGFNAEAKNSDIAIQRVKVNLGASTKIYTKGYSRIYVMDGSTVVASSDLNSSTVVKDGSNYYVTLTGFNFLVKKGEKKQLVVKADVMPSIDSADMDGSGSDDLDNIAITIPANGVRGIDGAGIDQYGPSDALTSRSVAFSASLGENATLKVSLNNSSPKVGEVVAASGASENELDKLSTLVFDVKAEKDAVTIRDMVVSVQKSGSGAATATTAYLFDGSTEIDNATINSTTGYASFTDIDLTVSKDSTKTLTVKVDVRSANGTVANFTTTASSTGIVSENSQGDGAEESGTATGYAIGVRNVGAEITLVSKSITTSGVPQGSGNNSNATSTLTATFNVKVKAVGGDLHLGTTGSTTPMFNPSTSFKVYKNGSALGANELATSTSYTIPSTCTTGSLTNSCILAEGNEVTIAVTYQIPGRSITQGALGSGLYSVGLERVNWNGSTQSATFMAGDVDWRTSDVSFP